MQHSYLKRLEVVPKTKKSYWLLFCVNSWVDNLNQYFEVFQLKKSVGHRQAD